METYFTFIIAIGGIATGVGAIWTAMLTRRQLGEQRRLLQEDAVIARRQAELMEQSLIQQRESLEGQNERARVSLEVDVMYRLWKQWVSPAFQNFRLQSSQYVQKHFMVDDELLEVNHIAEATHLLFQYFEEMGYLTRSGVVSIERVMNTYGRAIRLGWALGESAIKAQREEYSTPYRYANFEDLYHRALDYDRISGGTGARPTQAELKLFVVGSLQDDSELSPPRFETLHEGRE
jgi:hypothetical protein